jgi:DNA-binding NarL/FixJ family response regulator
MSLRAAWSLRQATLVLRQRIWLRFRGNAISESTVEAVAAQRHIIKRPRLTRLLDETTARIILLVAPAGYGKTTLAREWCEDRKGPTAWYQCTPASSDVAALAAGIAEAIHSSGRQVTGLRERMRLALDRDPRPDALASVIAHELSPPNLLLALDDLHLVTEINATNFIELLLERADLRVLITSRHKPSWATARRILYGEIFELRSNLLAMDYDEASAVLGPRRAADLPQLLVAAKGWPAVIGLAALTAGSAGLDFHESLYDYFADELYRAVPRTLRPKLLTLALLPSLAPSALRLVADSQIVSLALALGFVSVDRTCSYAFHPLLRSFLVRKCSQDNIDDLTAALEAVADHLIQNSMWDDALALLDMFPFAGHCLMNLIIHGSDQLLRAGRVATVARLVAMARERGLASPSLDLAEAEVSFRKGEHRTAYALAVRAASSIDISSHDLLRGFILAGRSATLADEFEQSIECYEAAYKAAVNPIDKINALWGQLTAANFLERADTGEILDELIAISHDSEDALLRITMARFNSTLWARTSLRNCLEHYRASEHIAKRSTDVLMVSAYLQTFAHIHILIGEYGTALQIADRLDALVEDHNLYFARPVAYGTRGYAQFGLGDYSEAAATADRLEEEATRLGDDHCILNARHIKARILLAAADYGGAVRMCMLPRRGHPARSMIGEVLATQGLAYACLHDWQRASDSLSEARATTRSLEAEGMAVWAEAVGEILRDEAHTQRALNVAVDYLESTAYVDGFVAAARACPRLMAHMRPFAHRLGQDADRLLLTPESQHTGTLSRREREVAALIGAGLTNREIATSLIISEATVKVHVRHILEKLKARSRAEVAARLAAREISMPPLA